MADREGHAMPDIRIKCLDCGSEDFSFYIERECSWTAASLTCEGCGSQFRTVRLPKEIPEGDVRQEGVSAGANAQAAGCGQGGEGPVKAKRGRPSIGKPWEAEGISRSKWFDRKRKGKPA